MYSYVCTQCIVTFALLPCGILRRPAIRDTSTRQNIHEIQSLAALELQCISSVLLSMMFLSQAHVDLLRQHCCLLDSSRSAGAFKETWLEVLRQTRTWKLCIIRLARGIGLRSMLMSRLRSDIQTQLATRCATVWSYIPLKLFCVGLVGVG